MPRLDASIADRIVRIEELSHRARIFLDLWKGVTLDTAVEPFENAFDEFDDFWRFSRAAYETMCLIRISNLFAEHKETENFYSLVRAARKAGAITTPVADACTAKLDQLSSLAKRVKRVRDKAMAHQNRVLAQAEVFGEAKLSLNSLTELSDGALELAGMLIDEVGLQRRAIFTRPSTSLRELLTFVEGRLASTF